MTVGEILTAVIAADRSDSLAWLTVDFTATQDSDSTEWGVPLRFDPDLSYRQIVEQ